MRVRRRAGPERDLDLLREEIGECRSPAPSTDHGGAHARHLSRLHTPSQMRGVPYGDENGTEGSTRLHGVCPHGPGTAFRAVTAGTDVALSLEQREEPLEKRGTVRGRERESMGHKTFKKALKREHREAV